MIRPATISGALSVLNRLRPEDEEEYRASLGNTSRGMAATGILNASPFCWVAETDEGRPAAVIAAHRHLPHRYGLSMAATEDWPRVWREVTTFIHREVIPALFEAGCRRAEALMVEGHPSAGKWLETLGAVHEAVMPYAGVNLETMHLYAFRASDPHFRARFT